MGFVALALVSLYHKSLPLFSNELIDILKINGGWLIGVGSCYFFGGTIYNRIKYDFKLEKYGSSEFKLDKMIYSLGFIFGVVFSLMFSLFQIFGIVFDDEYVKKQEKKAAVEEKFEEIRKSVPPLKQNETIIKNVINKDKIVLNFNQNQSSYFINFFEKDEITYWLFSVTVNKDERQYNYGKPSNKEAVSKQLYKVNTYPDSFVVTDVKTNDRWKVKYSKDQTLILKGQPSEEKILYILKDESKYKMYELTNSNLQYISNTRLDKDNNNLYVFTKDDIDPKKYKINYYIVNIKPRTDGSKLLGSPAILAIDEFPINLRYIMMLELSQLE